jgi:hypothetical protein
MVTWILFYVSLGIVSFWMLAVCIGFITGTIIFSRTKFDVFNGIYFSYWPAAVALAFLVGFACARYMR